MATEDESIESKESIKIEPRLRDARAFQNTFPDYLSSVSNETSLVKTTNELVVNQKFVARIKTFIEEQLERIGCKYLYKYDRQEDRTVYTGSCGIAYLFIQLTKSIYKDDEKLRKKFLEKAGEILVKVSVKIICQWYNYCNQLRLIRSL